MKKKLLAMLLVICMVMTFMPTVALAVGTSVTEPGAALDIGGEKAVVIANYNAELEEAPWDSISLSKGEDSAAGTVNLVLTATNVQKHANKGDTEGYWIGIGVPNPNSGKEDAEQVTVTWKHGWCDNEGKIPASAEVVASPDDWMKADGTGGDKTAAYATFYWGSDKTKFDGETKGYITATYGESGSETTDTYIVEFNVETEIEKTAPTADLFKVTVPTENLTYDGTAKEAQLALADGAKNITLDNCTVEYYKNGQKVTEAKEAGTYIVKVAVEGATGYNDGTVANDSEWTFTITQAALAGKKPVITGTAEAGQTLTASVDGVADSELTWAWTVGDNTSAGTAKTYTIAKADSNKAITV